MADTGEYSPSSFLHYLFPLSPFIEKTVTTELSLSSYIHSHEIPKLGLVFILVGIVLQVTEGDE